MLTQRIYGSHVFIRKLSSARFPWIHCDTERLPSTAFCPLPQSLFSSQAQFLLSSFTGLLSFVLLFCCCWLGWLVLQLFRGGTWRKYFTIKIFFSRSGCAHAVIKRWYFLQDCGRWRSLLFDGVWMLLQLERFWLVSVEDHSSLQRQKNLYR